MKQNERILVYLVTGFLAVILVVAVFFGRDGSAAGKPQKDETVRGLGQILDQKPVGGPGGGGPKEESGARPGDGSPGADSPGGVDRAADGDGTAPRSSEVSQPPLVASLPVPAAQRVAQLLGESRRDRTVRIVRARAGDSLESLVRRWCGKRDPYLEEARSLNEELTILRLGQEVVVPWVDDEDVLAAFEARQPRLLAGEPGSPIASPPAGSVPTGSVPTGSVPTGSVPASSPPSSGPGFRVPGAAPATNVANATNAAAGTVVYVVQPNDSLWKIAASRYGARNADRMIKEIKRLNDLSSDALQIKQKLVLPKGSSE